MISKDGRYSSSATWDALREKQELVDCYQLIWFPLAIPKHSFLSWFYIKNALVTGEKMLQRGFKGERQFVCFVGIVLKIETTCFSNVFSANVCGEF